MKFDDNSLKEILQSGSYVSVEDLKKAEGYAKSHRGSLVDYLMTEGLITMDLLGQAVAEAFKVTYADLNTNQPTREQVLKIPEEFAKQYRVVFFAESEASYTIATDNPVTPGLMEALAQLFPAKKITLAYSLPDDIDASFIYYRKPLSTRFAKIIESKERVAPEIIEEIFEDALAFKSSDIHFEPQDKELSVRFRIDGVLQEAARFDKQYYENILNRIKVQSNLRIDQHFAAQDGSLRFRGKNRTIDMRVSVVPTLEGEKIVIRILAHYVQGFSLGDIGLESKDQELMEAAARKPFGMILMTGPTGSGKTTTLYSILRLLNRPEVNITTIEDPVEYRVEGVNQIQVNPRTNLTFAKGLRSIVRQDPDIILVGEIRDEETAEIGVNAALTGHLMLSTFHANDAASSIPRLLDMGIEPFLLASTLNVIAAQRLARKICERCKFSSTVEARELVKFGPDVTQFFKEPKITLYRGKGCEACNGTGFSGRIGIFEIIVITPEIQDMILKSPSSPEIWRLAQKQGARSMFEDGVLKVKKGITTIEELIRVAAPPKAQADGADR